jgi:hypothetical protein
MLSCSTKRMYTHVRLQPMHTVGDPCVYDCERGDLHLARLLDMHETRYNSVYDQHLLVNTAA